MKFRAAVCLALLCSTLEAFSQNLVANGDFESPVINSQFVAVMRGDPTLVAWTVDAPSSNQGIDIISATYAGALASCTGAQAVDLAGTPGRGTIYQDLATTPGQTYSLCMWVSSIGGILNAMTIQWGGATVATISVPGNGAWKRVCYSVTAGSSVTRLSLIGNIDGNQGAFVDDVQAYVGPLPCYGDLNGDGQIDLADLAIELSHYGETNLPGNAVGDLDCNHTIDLADLSILLSLYGQHC